MYHILQDFKLNERQLKNGTVVLHKVLNIPIATTETLKEQEKLSSYQQFDVLNTPTVPTVELDDIFISVKTTKDYHDTRLSMIIKTWFQLAKDQVSGTNIFFCYEKNEKRPQLYPYKYSRTRRAHFYSLYKILNCKVDGREGEARRNIIANKFF